MSGIKEQKPGDAKVPSILNTLQHAFKLIFFKERSFILIFIDKRITYNLISIFLFMFLIPVKDLITGKLIISPEKIVESFLITIIYIAILYLFVIHKKINFIAFFRVFMAMEILDVFNVFTFLLSGIFLKIFVIILLSWYLSLSVVAISRLGKISYIRASLAVVSTFLFVNMLPALF
jgi:hypothetical protein